MTGKSIYEPVTSSAATTNLLIGYYNNWRINQNNERSGTKISECSEIHNVLDV